MTICQKKNTSSQSSNGDTLTKKIQNTSTYIINASTTKQHHNSQKAIHQINTYFPHGNFFFGNLTLHNVQEVRKPNLNTFQRISDIVGIKYLLLGGLDTLHYTLQKLGNLISDTP